LCHDPRDVVSENDPLDLLANNALPVDEEGFWHSRRSEGDLDAALLVRPDAVEGISEFIEKGRDILGSVTDRDAVDGNPCPLERFKLRRLRPARNAPAREHIDQPR